MPHNNEIDRPKDSLRFALLRQAVNGRLADADAPLLVQLWVRDPDRAAVIIKRLKDGKEISLDNPDNLV